PSARSVYCCHRSVSRISAAARNLRMETSPSERLPLSARARVAHVMIAPAGSTAAPKPSRFIKDRRPSVLLLGLAACWSVEVSSSFANFFDIVAFRGRVSRGSNPLLSDSLNLLLFEGRAVDLFQTNLEVRSRSPKVTQSSH